MSRHPERRLSLLLWLRLSREAAGRQVAHPAHRVSPNAYLYFLLLSSTKQKDLKLSVFLCVAFFATPLEYRLGEM